MTHTALTALTDESRALSAVLRELTPDDFVRLTNCPPWTLRELVVHIGDSIRVPDSPMPGAGPSDRLVTAADYYRRPERDTPAYRQRNVDRTQALAKTAPGGASVTQWFEDLYRRTVESLAQQDLARVVLIRGRGSMVLADWVGTRVLSVAAHGLDLATTLGRRPWTTGSALDVVYPILVDLLDGPPPAALHWDQQAFLAAATGRQALSDLERQLLGPLAGRFPLLS